MRQNLWRDTSEERFSANLLIGDKSADLVVIGGGFTGTSAALHAAELGLNVCLLEAHEIAHGGSGRNVGLVNAGQWLLPSEIESRLGVAEGKKLNSALANTPDLVFSLIEKHDIDCGAVRNGTLYCANTSAAVGKLKLRQEEYRQLGCDIRVLNKEETAERTGSKVYHGSLFDPGAGTINPLAYCRGLARAAANLGVDIHERSMVTAIKRTGKDWIVRTTRGAVKAKSIVLATNSYHLHAKGIRAPSFLPMFYFQMATEPLSEHQLEVILPQMEGCWDDGLIMTSFRRDTEGRLVIGSMGDLSHFGSKIHKEWARRKLNSLFPELGEVNFDHAWSGRIAVSRDNIPKIERLGETGWSAFGYSGRGIGPGTYFGKCIAAVIAGDSLDVLPLKPIEKNSHHLVTAQKVFYETGAAIYHFASNRMN
jgi:glycine/D-amino acid oxidase-like deaminating enzyme